VLLSEAALGSGNRLVSTQSPCFCTFRAFCFTFCPFSWSGFSFFRRADCYAPVRFVRYDQDPDPVTVILTSLHAMDQSRTLGPILFTDTLRCYVDITYESNLYDYETHYSILQRHRREPGHRQPRRQVR
jgi:hypothetical protein